MFNNIPIEHHPTILNLLANNSPVAFAYIDLNGNIITCNPSFEELFGYSLSEMTGKNIDQFISNSESLIEAVDLTQRVTNAEEILLNTTRFHRSGAKVEVESHGTPIIIDGKPVGVLVQYHNVTELVESEKNANALSSSIKLLLDSIDADVYVSDLTTYEVLFMNKHMEDSFGKDIIGKKCYKEFRHLHSPCPHCTNSSLVDQDGNPTEGVVWEGFNPLSSKWYKNSDKAVYWTNNKLVRLQIATDISEIKEAKNELEYLVLHDPLTGLANRSLFHDRLDQAIKSNKRESSQFAVIFLDLDNFKQINDTYGHQAGDLALKEIASRIQSSIRETDTLARVSGDEFTLLLEKINTIDEVIAICDRILNAIRMEYKYGENRILLTSSIGISIFPVDGTNIDSLVNNADFAMYKAKSLSGDQYIFFEPQQ